MATDSAYVFVDNSNLWIEGKKLSGKAHGIPENNRYRMEYGRLLEHVLDGRNLAGMPKLYGSEPPPADSVWRVIKSKGFDVNVFKRNFRNREKGIDMQLGLDAQELLYTADMATIIVVAGDADYVPLVKKIKSKGWPTEVWYWSRAAKDLKVAADRFESLDSAIDTVGFEER